MIYTKLDANKKEIHNGDTVEIISVPFPELSQLKDLIGRKYKVIYKNKEWKLHNDKYKNDQYREYVSVQWYLGEHCKII